MNQQITDRNLKDWLAYYFSCLIVLFKYQHIIKDFIFTSHINRTYCLKNQHFSSQHCPISNIKSMPHHQSKANSIFDVQRFSFMFEKHTNALNSIKLFKQKKEHTCLFHIYHFVQQSFVWKMSMISKNKVPDGGGENRHMFQLFLISHFLAIVKMKHTL